MKRIGLLPCALVAGAALLVAIYGTRDARFSVRLIHPRSAQLIDRIESGQSMVPATYEVLEVDEAAPTTEERVLVSRAEELCEEHIAAAPRNTAKTSTCS
jgi:hypothetical protein